MTQARPVGLPSHGQHTPGERPPGQKRAPKFEGLKDDELTRSSMCIWEMSQNFTCITYKQTDKDLWTWVLYILTILSKQNY